MENHHQPLVPIEMAVPIYVHAHVMKMSGVDEYYSAKYHQPHAGPAASHGLAVAAAA